MTTAFTLQPVSQFDQAGIMVRVDDDCWVKAGVEYTDGMPRLSCVVTNEGYSDWSTQVWPFDDTKNKTKATSVRVRVIKLLPGPEQGPSIAMEASRYTEGDTADTHPVGGWFQVRIASLRSGRKPMKIGGTCGHTHNMGNLSPKHVNGSTVVASSSTPKIVSSDKAKAAEEKHKRRRVHLKRLFSLDMLPPALRLFEPLKESKEILYLLDAPNEYDVRLSRISEVWAKKKKKGKEEEKKQKTGKEEVEQRYIQEFQSRSKELLEAYERSIESRVSLPKERLWNECTEVVLAGSQTFAQIYSSVWEMILANESEGIEVYERIADQLLARLRRDIEQHDVRKGERTATSVVAAALPSRPRKKYHYQRHEASELCVLYRDAAIVKSRFESVLNRVVERTVRMSSFSWLFDMGNDGSFENDDADDVAMPPISSEDTDLLYVRSSTGKVATDSVQDETTSVVAASKATLDAPPPVHTLRPPPRKRKGSSLAKLVDKVAQKYILENETSASSSASSTSAKSRRAVNLERASSSAFQNSLSTVRDILAPTLVVPSALKSVSRVCEKTMLRYEPSDRGDTSSVTDVVRGMIQSRNGMLGIATILVAIAAEPDVKILRMKERFLRAPSGGGWRDVLLNVAVSLSDEDEEEEKEEEEAKSERGAGDAEKIRRRKWRQRSRVDMSKPYHTCEIQIVHPQLLSARHGLPGHEIYGRVRNALELLERKCGPRAIRHMLELNERNQVFNKFERLQIKRTGLASAPFIIYVDRALNAEYRSHLMFLYPNEFEEARQREERDKTRNKKNDSVSTKSNTDYYNATDGDTSTKIQLVSPTPPSPEKVAKILFDCPTCAFDNPYFNAALSRCGRASLLRPDYVVGLIACISRATPGLDRWGLESALTTIGVLYLGTKHVGLSSRLFDLHSNHEISSVRETAVDSVRAIAHPAFCVFLDAWKDLSGFDESTVRNAVIPYFETRGLGTSALTRLVLSASSNRVDSDDDERGAKKENTRMLDIAGHLAIESSPIKLLVDLATVACVLGKRIRARDVEGDKNNKRRGCSLSSSFATSIPVLARVAEGIRSVCLDRCGRHAILRLALECLRRVMKLLSPPSLSPPPIVTSAVSNGDAVVESCVRTSKYLLTCSVYRVVRATAKRVLKDCGHAHHLYVLKLFSVEATELYKVRGFSARAIRSVLTRFLTSEDLDKVKATVDNMSDRPVEFIDLALSRKADTSTTSSFADFFASSVAPSSRDPQHDFPWENPLVLLYYLASVEEHIIYRKFVEKRLRSTNRLERYVGLLLIARYKNLPGRSQLLRSTVPSMATSELISDVRTFAEVVLCNAGRVVGEVVQKERARLIRLTRDMENTDETA
eukprot:g2699.t1